MGTENYSLPLVSGMASAKVPRDLNALANAVDVALKNLNDAKSNSTDMQYALAAKANLNDVASKVDKMYLDTLVQSIASGGPKGVYNTPQELTAAFPSGNTNIYIVLSDNKWYYWSAGAWHAGAVYQSAVLASESVTFDKVALKRKILVTQPSEFDWNNHALLGKIFTDGEGRFTTSFDVATLAPTGKTYYVNQSTGSDTNDGLTAGTALKSVHIAGKKSDAVEIIVASGYYDDGTAMNGWAIDKNLSIKAAPGADVTLSTRRNQAGVWVKTAGYTNIYQVTRTLVANVYDKKFKDVFGDDFQLLPTSTLAVLDTSPGRMFYEGSTLYVHTSDSRVPDIDVTVFLDLYNVSHFGGKTVYLENIKVEGGKYPVYVQNDTGTTTTFLAKNCTFKYSSATGSDGATSYGANVIYQNCVASKNLDDGFSHNFYNNFPTRAIEIDCIGRNNGRTGNNDNGTTSHDGCFVIRLNGAYFGNYGPNLADVGGSKSWNLGCVVADSKATTEAGNRGAVAAGNNGVQGSKVWLDNCTLYGNKSDIYSDVDNPVYVRRVYKGTSNNLEKIY